MTPQRSARAARNSGAFLPSGLQRIAPQPPAPGPQKYTRKVKRPAYQTPKDTLFSPACALQALPLTCMPQKRSPSAPHPAVSHSLNPPEIHLSSPSSEPTNSSVRFTPASSRQPSRSPSPLTALPSSVQWDERAPKQGPVGKKEEEDSDNSFEAWDEDYQDEDRGEDDTDMPSDLRPPYHRPNDGRSQQPLLASKGEPRYDSPTRPPLSTRRSTFRERDPDLEAKSATRKRYTYAGAFLLLSLITFTVQTETAVYIQHNLGWNKAYCML